MSEWIRVADRLPEKTGAYIVCYIAIEPHKVAIYVTPGNFYRPEDAWYIEGEPNHSITHWMPFPDPPEEIYDNQTQRPHPS